MKIPVFPQVLFDEFPTDASTKICILTRPHYPFPDLSPYDGKLLLYCTESTTRLMARYTKKVPFSLFRMLPEEEHDNHKSKWLIIDNLSIDGFNTPLALTCIPTGSANGSVMLLIFNKDAPDSLMLYTGHFKRGHQLLLSSMIFKYKSKICDVYYDSSMADSLHRDIDQDHQACDDIREIIKKYPGYEFHLQMEPFESLDLVVHLARHQHINVKLSEIQQIFCYKTHYKNLFKYDTPLIANLGLLNKSFRFEDRPMVRIKSVKIFDLATYKRLFDEQKIINIKLIASAVESLRNQKHDGLFYVSYSSHAGAFTISSIVRTIQPKNAHPFK